MSDTQFLAQLSFFSDTAKKQRAQDHTETEASSQQREGMGPKVPLHWKSSSRCREVSNSKRAEE